MANKIVLTPKQARDRFETAMKLLTCNLLDSVIPKDMVKIICSEYNIDIKEGATFCDALQAVFFDDNIEERGAEKYR